MLHVTAVMKRFHQNPSESLRPIKKLKHYACLEGKAFLEIRRGKHAINVLLDSGSNIFLMNQDTARRLEIPTGARDSPLKIRSFDGQTAPKGAIFYTHPILLEIGANGHRSMISCKVANAGKYDLIIACGWWHDEHPLKNITEPSIWVFEEAKCHAHIEDEAVADVFEGDETMAYDEEAQYVGQIEQEEEGGVRLETLPKPYSQYKELFEEKKAKMLAPRRTFDHPINLKEGAEPPWGPIYPMSAYQLNELDKYLKKILTEGKIADSESLYGASIISKKVACVRPSSVAS